MKYTYSTLQDFLQDDSFVRWVLFSDNNVLWESFLLNNPDKEVLFTQAQNLIINIKNSQDWNVENLDKSKIWNRIQVSMDSIIQEEVPNANQRKNYFKNFTTKKLVWSVCTFVIFIGCFIWISGNTKSYPSYNDLVVNSENPNQRIQKINNSDVPQLIKLEDGSTILLRKNSRISYPTHFNNKEREVILSGEAFFKIAKNPSKPFYVYAKGSVTKVLGTSFDIKANDDDEKVIVNVFTGRVSVYSNAFKNDNDPEKEGVVLLPNQQVVLDLKKISLTRKLVEEPHKVFPLKSDDQLHFDEVPVSMILKKIEELYGLQFVYNEEQLAKCVITTTLTDEPLYNQLAIICTTIGATYKEIDAQIIIESTGCK